jgi:glyoxylase-like metal-dependent hydrolase (beta-lactamase superfamily II)
VVGRDPAWVIDPGPALQEHLDAVAAALAARGGAAGVLLTHDHADHSAGARELADRLGAPLAAAAPSPGASTGEEPRGLARAADVALTGGDTFGPFSVLAVPGHADDHLVFVAGPAAFTGDAVLGQGSVFVSGRLREYLAGLRALRELPLQVLCPGHGDEVWDPAGKLDEYLAHRAMRERRLVAALDAGVRGEDALLDAAWPEAPPAVRGFAALSLRAHLEKLREDGREI